MVENSPRIPFSLDDSLKCVEGTMPKAPQMTMEVVASSTLPNVPKQPETADGRLEERMKLSDNVFFFTMQYYLLITKSALNNMLRTGKTRLGTTCSTCSERRILKSYCSIKNGSLNFPEWQSYAL